MISMTRGWIRFAASIAALLLLTSLSACETARSISSALSFQEDTPVAEMDWCRTVGPPTHELQSLLITTRININSIEAEPRRSDVQRGFDRLFDEWQIERQRDACICAAAGYENAIDHASQSDDHSCQE